MSYADEFIKRMMRIERLVEGQSFESRSRIKKLNEKILDELNKIEKMSFAPLARNRAILKINEEIKKAYKEIKDEMDDVTKQLIQKESNFYSDIFKIYSEKKIVDINRSVAFQNVYDRPFQGRTFTDWFNASSASAERKIFRAMQTGFVQGKTVSDISDDVSRILKVSANDVKTLVRSNFMATANEVRDMSVKENQELFEYKIWLSVLDSRTTPHICGIRDGLKYTMQDEPIEHGEPWETGPGSIHFNCRSAWIPKIEGVPMNANRPSVGAGENYERGDNKTSTGRVRKPTRANIENGIFDIKQKDFRGKYEGWLRTQPKPFVADVLGSVEKATLFKSGASLSSVTSYRYGRPLTINQL